MTDWVPIDACTLPTVEQPLRVDEFDALFADAAVGVTRVAPTHVRIELLGGADLAERVRDLTQRESECCSFFSFALTGENPLILDVEVPPEHVDVLAGIEQRVDRAIGSA